MVGDEPLKCIECGEQSNAEVGLDQCMNCGDYFCNLPGCRTKHRQSNCPKRKLRLPREFT